MTITSHRVRLIVLVSMGVLAVVGIVSAETASNSVPPSRMGQSTYAIGPNELKPTECSGLVLVNTMVATGQTLTGTNDADLLVGIAITRTITGRQGDDCIVSNAVAQTVDGGGGYDVCIGPAGTSFTRCEVTVIR